MNPIMAIQNDLKCYGFGIEAFQGKTEMTQLAPTRLSLEKLLMSENERHRSFSVALSRWKVLGLFKLFFAAWLLSQNTLFATEHLPWLGDFLQPEFRQSLYFQSFTSYRSESHSIKGKKKFPLFYDCSLAICYPAPFQLELEAMAASTRKQSGGIDHLKATGRYQILNDISGDPISIIFGCSLIQAFQASLHDPMSFHHGRSEAELFISIGKERSYETTWISRGWGWLAWGFAERGKPWIRGKIGYEWRMQELYECRLFLDLLKGSGFQSLHLQHF